MHFDAEQGGGPEDGEHADVGCKRPAGATGRGI
jgi:hypothetical protein